MGCVFSVYKAAKIRILIVDDSLVFRSAVQKALEDKEDIQVIGSVRNGVKAMEFIKATPPDLVTLDVEMPEMDGLQTLNEIQTFNMSNSGIPDIGVIMVSAYTHKGADTTIQALENGAFDFVTKPESGNIGDSVEMLQGALLVKIRQFARQRKEIAVTPTAAQHRAITRPKTISRPDVASATTRAVVIGVSTGGPKALAAILPELTEIVDVPIFIVQHMPPLFTKSLADSLDKKCKHRVVEATEGDAVRDGYVYIAPGGKHMILRQDGPGKIVTGLSEKPPENGCRPAADVLFRSAASVYKSDVITIVLTGMGSDGTKGIGPLKRAGGYVIVQDESTSVVWGMPGSAVETGYVDEIQPLDKIPGAVKIAMKKRAENAVDDPRV